MSNESESGPNTFVIPSETSAAAALSEGWLAKSPYEFMMYSPGVAAK